MGNSIEQHSAGDLSPNIVGNSNLVAKTVNIYDSKKIKLASEVRTMLVITNLVHDIALKKSYVEEEYNFEGKDLKIKFEQRFAKYQVDLKEKFLELRITYRDSYEEAKRNAIDDELSLNEYAMHLRNISNLALKETDGNPLEALALIVGWCVDEFQTQKEVDFSRGAIEYYLYQELVNCNVFPNPQ